MVAAGRGPAAGRAGFGEMIVLAVVGVALVVAVLVFLAVIGLSSAYVVLVIGGFLVFMAAYGGSRAVRR